MTRPGPAREPSNPEASVKILDGRAFNGHFWVYWTSLTDAGFTLRVSDDETGLVRSWEIPTGAPVSGADVTRF